MSYAEPQTLTDQVRAAIQDRKPIAASGSKSTVDENEPEVTKKDEGANLKSDDVKKKRSTN